MCSKSVVFENPTYVYTTFMSGKGLIKRMGERRDTYRVLVRKSEGRRPLERPRCRWKDNIKMDLREVG
jgi:hypothetical protein